MTRHVAAAALALGAWSIIACSNDASGPGPNSSLPVEDAGSPTSDAATELQPGDAASMDAGLRPTEHAGSRLTPVYTTTQVSDGASIRWFAAWQDTTRNERCYGQRLADDKLHCAPIAPAIEFEAQDTYFLDAQCTTPIAGVRKAAPSCPGGGDYPTSDKYVTRVDQTPQCSATRIYSAPASPLNPSNVYQKTGSNCVGQGNGYLTSNWDFYLKSALTSLAEVAPSAFVEMTRAEESTVEPSDRVTVGSRVHPVMVTMKGADGSSSRGLQNFLDFARSEFCSPPTILSDGKLHCAPSGSWFYDDSYFLDSSCTAPAINVQSQQATPACDRDDRNGKYLISREATGCGITHLFQFPTQSSYSEIYYKTGNQCSDFGPVGTSSFIFPKAPMTEIAPSAFVEFTLSYAAADTPNGAAGTHLAPVSMTYAGADGFSWTGDTGEFQDKQTQTMCVPTLLSDGQLHCVPTYAQVEFDTDANYFADAACSQPVVAVTKSGTCRGFSSPATLIGKLLQVNGCGAIKLFPLPSTALAPAALYFKNGQTCAPDNANGPSYLQTYDFYSGSATQASNVDPSTFPTVTVTTSP